MSKKNRNRKKVEQKRTYQKPTETIWGRLIVWFLIIAMLGGIVFGLVAAIIQLF